LKKCSSQRTLAKFLTINKNGKKLGHVTKRFRQQEASKRHENGRMKHAGTEENVTTADELIAILNHRNKVNEHAV